MARRSILRFATAVLAGASLAACVPILGDFDLASTAASTTSDGGSGVGGSAGSGATGGEGGAALSLALTVDPPSLRVLRGSSAELEVTLTRQGPVGDVTVVAGDLPAGVTAASVLVAAAEVSGTLTVDVATTAAPGAATITVGDESMLATPLDVPLLVADPPGTLDDSFDDDGATSFAPTGGDTAAAALHVVEQPDGQLVVGGTLTNATAGAGGWAVIRMGSDGSRDATFDTNAAAALPSDGQLYGVAVDPFDGAIVAAGRTGGTPQLTVVRLNANGTADDSFGNNGIFRADPVTYGQGTEGLEVVVQADSRIVVAGTILTPTPQGLVMRLTSGGALDATFGSNGTFRAQTNTSLRSVLLDGSGRIAFAGRDGNASPPDFLVTRLTSAGAIDTAFAAGGSVSYGDGALTTHEIVALPNGNLVSCGEDNMGLGLGVLGQLTPTGTLAWTGAGTLSYAIHGNHDKILGCAATADGQIVFVGIGNSASDFEGYVVRVSGAGVEDASFGTAGVVSFGPSPVVHRLYDVAVQADGRIVAVGNKSDVGWFLARIWD